MWVHVWSNNVEKVLLGTPFTSLWARTQYPLPSLCSSLLWGSITLFNVISKLEDIKHFLAFGMLEVFSWHSPKSGLHTEENKSPTRKEHGEGAEDSSSFWYHLFPLSLWAPSTGSRPLVFLEWLRPWTNDLISLPLSFFFCKMGSQLEKVVMGIQLGNTCKHRSSCHSNYLVPLLLSSPLPSKTWSSAKKSRVLSLWPFSPLPAALENVSPSSGSWI